MIMSLTVHKREISEAQNAQKGANLQRQTEFSGLMKALSEPPKLSKTERIRTAVFSAAQQQNLDPNLVFAVIKQESGFKECATSHCGAQGLMQLMPATAKGLGVANSYNIEQNVHGGAKYLRQMLNKFDGNLKLAVAAYNAGPGAIQKYDGIPPYAETQNYVKAVMAHYQKYNGGAELPEFADTDMSGLMKNLEAKLAVQMAVSNAIVSRPMDLPMPEPGKNRSDDEPPPPPPPTAMRV